MAGLLLAACTAGPLFRPDTYTVRRGDTLYSIAWRYGVDWRRLARWNGIGPPYDIYPGDVLHLDGRTRSVASSSSPSASGSNSGASRDSGQRTARASSPAPRGPTSSPMTSDLDWRWPVGGEVLRGYSASHARRGIDIAGSTGDAVRAAAPGRVVYSGSGLKGYGNLVIIKHDDRFLSAYGFNRRLRVGQGETVGAGQHIADVGLGPENRAMLYFEIRRDGEPVDPQRLLPRR